MSGKKAFTLIELLVVISVIALLMAILMPALQKAREQGMRAACLSNIKQLLLAWILYADANDDKIVSGFTHYQPKDEHNWLIWDPDQMDKSEQTQIDGIKDGALFPYVRDVKLYRCPVGERGEMRTYSIVDSMNAAGTVTEGPVIKNRMQILRPTDRIVFIDDGGRNWESWSIYYNQPRWWNPAPIRHSIGTNFSFADGHSEYWKWKDPRTKGFNWRMLEVDPYQPGNEDLQRVQRGVWGELGYEPQ